MPPQQKKPHTIPTITAVLMAAVALLFDAVQAGTNLLHLIPYIGNLSAIIATTLMDVWAFLTLYVWFKLHGVSFANPKRGLTMAGTLLIEVIPALNALPAWTAAVVIIFLTTRAEELLEKIPGGSKIAAAVQIAGGTPSAGAAPARKPPAVAEPPRAGRVPPRLSDVRSPA